MFHKSVMRGEAGDAESGEAVQKTELEKICLDEGDEAGEKYL